MQKKVWHNCKYKNKSCPDGFDLKIDDRFAVDEYGNARGKCEPKVFD